MSAVIKLENVTKNYGKAVGVRDINLTVNQGEAFGFIGPNGAGKTTTISMLVDLIRPTSGAIKLFGLDSVRDSLKIRQRIGFLGSDSALDKGLTGWQQLEYFGALRGKFDKKYVKELAERLDCKLDRKFKTLSRGNKQKVSLISALMHQPELLILDEPTSGLDPLMQAEFNKLILEFKKAGRTVFISSHVLSEVQETCDTVAFIRHGQLTESMAIHDIMAAAPKTVHITGADKNLYDRLSKINGIEALRTHGTNISCSFNGDPNELIAALAVHRITTVTIQEADLETIFMKYYKQAMPGETNNA